MQYKIRWAKRAVKRYTEILDYWCVHNLSSEYAEKIDSEVSQWIKLIKENPFIGSSQERTYRNRPIRAVVILKNFKLYYLVQGKEVFIVNFKSNSTKE